MLSHFSAEGKYTSGFDNRGVFVCVCVCLCVYVNNVKKESCKCNYRACGVLLCVCMWFMERQSSQTFTMASCHNHQLPSSALFTAPGKSSLIFHHLVWHLRGQSTSVDHFRDTGGIVTALTQQLLNHSWRSVLFLASAREIVSQNCVTVL